MWRLTADGTVDEADYDAAYRLADLYEGAGTTVWLGQFDHDPRGLPESRNGGGGSSNSRCDPTGRLTQLSRDLDRRVRVRSPKLGRFLHGGRVAQAPAGAGEASFP